MKRACLLSLFVLVSIATLLPFVDSAAQRAAEAAGVSARGGGGRVYMSDEQWRAFVKRRAARRRRARLLARARARRQAILAARLQRRQQTTMSAATFKTTAPIVPVIKATQQARSPFMMTAASGAPEAGTRAPFAMRAPEGWQRETMSVNGETRFSLRGAEGTRAGAAFFTRLNPGAVGGAVGAGATRAALRNQIAGISFAALRRTVIDKMIEERGWVANDMEREIGGRRVFIVLAQTGDNQAWTYYFTELNGQLYSLAVKSAVHDAATIAAQSAQFIGSLRSNDQPAVAAEPPQR